MSLKKFLILLVALAVLFAVYWFFFLRAVNIIAEPVVVEEQNNLQQQETISVINGASLFDQEPREATVLDLKNMAIFFTQKYGSFSNQANYDNLKDIDDIITEDMRAWLDEQRGNDAVETGDYYGVDSRAISADALNFNNADGRATILVNLLRQDTNGESGEKQLRLEFKKVDGIWKIDGAYEVN